MILDGDLHVVIDTGAAERTGEPGILVGPHGSVRRHASGLSLEPLDESLLQPVQIDVFEEISPRLGVNDHGREHTVLAMGV